MEPVAAAVARAVGEGYRPVAIGAIKKECFTDSF
jgi:hypothetical protein